MTVLVVDFLKVVEIEHKQSGRTVVPAGTLQFTLKQVQQRTAIPDSGQDIVGCLKTQLFARANQALRPSPRRPLKYWRERRTANS